MRLLTRLHSLRAVWLAPRLLNSRKRLFSQGYGGSNITVTDITVPVPWGSVAGKWWGATDVQPIIAVHGYEDNAGSFDGLAPLLVSESTSVLAIDLPGHGLSSHYPLGMAYNFMDGVILLQILSKYFKWDKVSIIAHSFGSKVAFTYAAFFPEKVENLVGIDCVRAHITQKEEDVVYHLKTTIEHVLNLEEKMSKNKPPAYSMDGMISLVQRGSRGPMSKKCIETILKRGAKKSDINGKFCFSRDPRLRTLPFGRLSEEMLFACASRVSCNVLQIIANPGWKLGDSEARRKTDELMKKGAKRFEEHVVEGSHHIHVDAPERVAPIVKNFIAMQC
ncbi:probable serine hydrolase [Ischnura elegans]|uniref:probable serine hydrolase n=1 Tax=Ischnura elegans TaxID=197161 RepID=UPI001ED88315|nr:probable serine hydrolase [Ischnura elegans]